MKLEEQFIDADNKIIADCPHCGSQEVIYLIRANRIKEGLEPLECESCKTVYVVNIETELTCRAEVYECESTGKRDKLGAIPPRGDKGEMKVYYYTILVTVAGMSPYKPEHELKSQAELIAKKIKTLPGVATATLQTKSRDILCRGEIEEEK